MDMVFYLPDGHIELNYAAVTNDPESGLLPQKVTLSSHYASAEGWP